MALKCSLSTHRKGGGYTAVHRSLFPSFMMFLLLTAFTFLLNHLDEVSADDCPPVFKRYSMEHSYCRPANRSCNIMAYYLTEEDKTTIMNLHNSYRNGIAAGTTASTAILPTSGDMLEMEWDDELAAVAQKYAEQCLFQHDCPNCRRVLNFDVGQNIAIQKWVGGYTIPQPDWNFAVTEWFSEIIYFPISNICPFQPPNGGNEYRHFSQLVWSKTFRVGCGYVLYKEGTETYVRLYICNYGPAGNVYDTCVYKAGPPCSNCPENTCCGSSCYYGKIYYGLCKRTNNEALQYPAPPDTLFFCDFHGGSDCVYSFEENVNWIIQSTLSGNYMSITLNGGENSTLVFQRYIQPKLEQFCVTLKYRKGANMDGDELSNKALEIFYAPERAMTVTQELPAFGNSHTFATYTMTLNWKFDTQLKLSFAVPNGKPAQFFHIQSVIATNGPCQS